jgi:actin-like ATPase involved in cell morphogenesis
MDIGYFRRKQLIEDIAKQIAVSQGWEIKERPTQEPKKSPGVVGTIVVDNTPYKDEARYNKIYDIAEKVVDTVLAAINEDLDEGD